MSILPSTLPERNSIHSINSIDLMANHQVLLSAGFVTIGTITLPIYQFSQTEYAFPLSAILQFLKIEDQPPKKILKSFTATNSQTNLPEDFISTETFVALLVNLSQKKRHPKATEALQCLASQGFKVYLQNYSNSIGDNLFVIAADSKPQVQPPSNASDIERISIELKFNTDASLEAELPDQDYLQKIRQRNESLLHLLDEWNANPDYESDYAWDEVMASL